MKNGDTGKTREQLVEELQDLREKLVQLASLSEVETIFKILPGMYFRLDENSTILDYKTGTFTDPGLKPDVSVGKQVRDLFPAIVGRKMEQAVREVKETQSLNVFEFSLSSDGEEFFYETRLIPFETHFLAIVRNITGQKQVEEELKKHREHLQVLVDERTIELETINVQLQEEVAERKKAEEELHIAKEAAESANRLKSRFLANMSHDIRTPLNAILGFADLVLKGDIDERSRHHTRRIVQAGDALLTLLNDILDFSKIEAGQLDIHPRTFRFPELVESLNSMFSFQFYQKGVLFLVNTGQGVPEWVYGDKWRIHQVLSNLLSNALKFTDHGEVAVDISYQNAEDRLRISVKDTGAGMPQQELETIFQPFTRLQSDYTQEKEGTGIGLTICKDIANQLGGRIWVESTEGVGSRFTFEIPANSDNVKMEEALPCESARESVTAEDLEPKLGNKILIVDDSPVNRELIKEYLETAGFYDLLEAVNGREAIEVAMEHMPDLTLMDIQMPEMDGNEAILKLRGQGFGKPIIALSAFAMREYIEKSLTFGANAYIAKPVDFKRFFSKIRPFLKDKVVEVKGTGEREKLIFKESVSERVRQVFTEDALQKLTELIEAVNGGAVSFEKKADEIKRIAHGYKGNAGVLGLPELETAARELDEAFRKKESHQRLMGLTKKMALLLGRIIKENKQEQREKTGGSG